MIPTLTDAQIHAIADALRPSFLETNALFKEIYAARCANTFHVRAFRAHPLKVLRTATSEQLRERRTLILHECGKKFEILNIEKILREREQEKELMTA